MFLLRPLVVIICVLFVFAAPASAAVIDFEDIVIPNPDTDLIDLAGLSPYQGFNWTNFDAYGFSPLFPQFNTGITSGTNAAFSGGELGDPGSEATRIGQIDSPTPFNFVSAYFGAINYTSMSLTVQGFQGAVMTASTTITLDNNGADQFFFPTFTNLTSLRLFGVEAGAVDNGGCGTFNCTQFSVDDLATTTPVPEPSTLALVGAGALAGLRRLRRRR